MGKLHIIDQQTKEHNENIFKSTKSQTLIVSFFQQNQSILNQAQTTLMYIIAFNQRSHHNTSAQHHSSIQKEKDLDQSDPRDPKKQQYTQSSTVTNNSK